MRPGHALGKCNEIICLFVDIMVTSILSKEKQAYFLVFFSKILWELIAVEFLGLYYFCTVVQEGSISKAAERLYMTQQSLSGYLARLEKKYGCTLFVRRPKFCLSPEGELFYSFAKHVTEENETVKQLLASGTVRRQRLPIGISHNNERLFLPWILPLYREACPDILPSVRITNRSREEASLQNMDIYCSISATNQKYPGVQAETLMPCPFYAVIPRRLLREAPLPPGRRTISLEELMRYPVILPNPSSRLRRTLNIYCEKHQILPRIDIESNSSESSYEYSKLGYGCFLMPKPNLYYLMQNHPLAPEFLIYALDLQDSHISADTVNILYRKDVQLPEYIWQFIQCAKEACTQRNLSIDAAIQEAILQQV